MPGISDVSFLTLWARFYRLAGHYVFRMGDLAKLADPDYAGRAPYDDAIQVCHSHSVVLSKSISHWFLCQYYHIPSAFFIVAPLFCCTPAFYNLSFSLVVPGTYRWLLLMQARARANHDPFCSSCAYHCQQSAVVTARAGPSHGPSAPPAPLSRRSGRLLDGSLNPRHAAGFQRPCCTLQR